MSLAPGLRFSILQRDGFQCRYCGATQDDGAKLNVDHRVPVSKGGDDRPENLVTACWECNIGKGTRRLYPGDFITAADLIQAQVDHPDEGEAEIFLRLWIQKGKELGLCG